MTDLVRIDGSEGEGGGQMLRTALALSMVTGRPFEIVNIRAGREKPGLRHQHLACVKAAAKVASASVEGAVLASRSLRFEPGQVRPGTYDFDIKTAGSTSLVLHTLYLPLALAPRRSVLTLSGGTHVPFSPSFHYLMHQWAVLMRRVGIDVELTLTRAGFFPEGNGEIRAKILPAPSLRPLTLGPRGKLERLEGVSAVGGLPRSIADRQRNQALSRLDHEGLAAGIEVREVPSAGKGTFLLLLAAFEGGGRACFDSLGALGKRAEKVADEACDALLEFLRTQGAVDSHAADQLLLPLALASGQSQFHVPAVTSHLLTNARVIELFIPNSIRIAGEPGAEGVVTVTPAAAVQGWVLAPAAFAAGSDALRVGLIGCGGRGAGAAVNAMDADAGARLVAMADLFADRVKAKRQLLKEKKPGQVAVDDAHCFAGFEGYRKVIESADVVLIAIAPKFHAAYTRAAVEAGRHVFVEKAHAIDPQGVRDLVAARDLARQKKLSVVSGLYSRYDPGYQETIKRVRDGAIGAIVAIEETALRGPYGLFRRDPRLSELQNQLAQWPSFAWLSGDDVNQGLIHGLDRANWAMGDQQPVKCHALGGRASPPEEAADNLFDHHSVVYEYANGVKLYAFARTQTGCFSAFTTVILGTKGRCFLAQWRIEGENKWRYRRPDGPRDSPYDAEHKVLFRAIRSGNPVNNGDYMVQSAMAGVMGQLSCYTGKELTPELLLASSFALGPKADECSFNTEPPVKPDAKGVYPVPIPGVTRLS